MLTSQYIRTQPIENLFFPIFFSKYENQTRGAFVAIFAPEVNGLNLLMVKYIEFLLALDLLAKYYPQYHSHELFVLADDIWKWLNDELPEDSSALVYLKRYFNTPAEALRALWREMQLLSGPFLNLN